MEDLQIVHVGLKEGGDLEIAYVRLPQDVRKNGLVWQHNVHVPRGSDYDDELDTFYEALIALLTDVLDDEDRAEPIDMTKDDDEDEEED